MNVNRSSRQVRGRVWVGYQYCSDGKPANAYDVATSANNTVEVALNNDSDAALELLADIVTVQPWYIGSGLNGPLADALKQTAKIIRSRPAQIDAAIE